MDKPRFVGIGKLGGRDSEGYHHVMIKPEYRNVFSGLSEIYLIFDRDRVFFVTITDKKMSDRKLWMRFAEDGVAEERSRHKDVILAITDEEGDSDMDDLDYLVGYTVLIGTEQLGVVTGYFSNSAQNVIQITDSNGVEIMVPFVPHYIQAVLDAQQCILLINAEGLVEFYRSESQGSKA